MESTQSRLAKGPFQYGARTDLPLLPDGGGIRGFWSLLALEKLMEYIADEESNLDENDEICHSFSPEDWPENVSQIPRGEKEWKDINEASTDDAKLRAMARARRFLPCHYFDHICGSSTGSSVATVKEGLIIQLTWSRLSAIMLGRFRMTVPDCIQEYKNLGEKVFGKPRTFCTLRFGIIPRERYKAARLEEVFRDVAARREEMQSELQRRITFPSGRGMSKT